MKCRVTRDTDRSDVKNIEHLVWHSPWPGSVDPRHERVVQLFTSERALSSKDVGIYRETIGSTEGF